MSYRQVLDKSRAGSRLDNEDGEILFREAPLMELAAAANAKRQAMHPERRNLVTFVIDRNINYTNTCTAACRFCAFAFWPGDERTYQLPYETIATKISELRDAGGTQVLIQGGHNPDLGIEYYEDLFGRIKRDFPEIVVHSLSPSELDHICEASSLDISETVRRLRASGWDSFPGGGAEILVERVRKILSPLKTSSGRWLEIMEEAHRQGIGGSATMMFAHVETYRERVLHMARIRDLQDRTGGFRAFISWPFQKGNTPLSRDQRLEEGEGTGDVLDTLRTLAISRLFLDNVPNVQSPWVTEGLACGQVALHCGANDFGGTMLEENVVSAAGARHSKSTPDEIANQIRKAGFVPAQRDTYYNILRILDTQPTEAATQPA